MNESSIDPGEYVKCLRGPAAEPEIVRVVSHISEPSYLLRTDGGGEFQCPASLVETLSSAEEIEYWRNRAQAAEKAKQTPLGPIVRLSASTQPDGSGGALAGVTNDNGILIARCMTCPETHELEELTTTIAAALDLRDAGWLLTDRDLKCPMCVETSKMADTAAA